jgi:hypothetical protein
MNNGRTMPTNLYKGLAKFGAEPNEWDTLVSLVWDPDPRIEFAVLLPEDRMDVALTPGWDKEGIALVLSDGPICIAKPDDWEYLSDGVLMRGEVEPVGFGSEMVTKVRADLINFSQINRPVRTEMVGGGWRLTLRSVPETDSREHSYFRTGSVAISREDGSPFGTDLAVAVLDAFDYFASLAMGSWAAHALPVGLDAKGRRTWRRWAVGRIDPSHMGDGWATHYKESAGVLASMWPGFITKWTDPVWQPTVRTLTALLTEATGHTDGEAALLMIDVILELLSFAVVVTEGRMVSAEGHDRLFGSDRLRLLLAVCQIDGRIPAGLHVLAKQAQQQQWIDGPHAISSIRDAVVHPRKRASLSRVSAETIDLVQLLARDYAHGAIAHLFGANGWEPWATRWLEPKATN